MALIILILSCQSGPEPVASQDPAPPAPAAPQTAVVVEEPTPVVVAEVPEEVFDPENVSEELYISTMAEVQALIGELNAIIRARNYTAWRGYLAEDYYQLINSPAFLEERTEELYRRDQIIAANLGRTAQRRILRTSRDYFEHIVIPSRSNDRVDDIDFISDNRVRAYTIDSRGNSLILYDLEIIDGNWRIVF